MSGAWEPPREVEEYQLMRSLGRGAMGEVWLAHDTLLDRPVAIKFIVGNRNDDTTRSRFFTEARAIARLDHPNVIRIHRVGEVAGRPFLVAEYLRGESFDHLPRPIDIADAGEIALGLARGLAAAHRRGILHRDVKPANAFRTEDGQIKLLDFGLAKVIEAEDRAAPSPPANRPASVPGPPRELEATLPGGATPREDASATVVLDVRPTVTGEPRSNDRPSMRSPIPESSPTLVGTILGTPSYLAPELWSGEGATLESDVYSLGATLYELIGGVPPHTATTMAQLAWKAAESDVAPLQSVRPEVPIALARVIDKCVRRDPSQRYASAEAVCAELEAIVHQSSVGDLPEGNPYRGLSAFDEHHRGMFFGRDREIAEMIERLRSEPWLVVAGRSGAGKSSVVRAGLVPRIRGNALDERTEREPWRVITMVPGEHPMAALVVAAAAALDRDERDIAATLREDPTSLARELRGGHHGTLLVIDQLEELITISDPNERERFVEALAPTMVLTRDLRVVATIRSDFVGQLDDAPSLARAVGRALLLLGPLDREGLRAAVTAPAAAYGFRFESDADVETLIGGIAPHAGGLPLLEFALARLWELRDPERHIIPSRALHEIGGVEGALARHADDVIAVLSPAARAAARRLLLSMVSADRTRTRRTADELCGGLPSETREATRSALDALVQARLLAVGEDDRGPSYELAHEALLTHWTRLRVWLDEADIDHATRARIELAAADWDRQGRSPDGLWRGQQIAAVATLPLDDLGAVAREFVERGRSAHRRGQRRRRGLVIGGFAILTAWLTIALWLHDRAGVARDRAQASATAAQARTAALYQEQGRQALTTGDPMRSVAYLVEAYASGQRGPELRFLVDRASAALDGDIARLAGHTDKVSDVTWSRDGTRVATSSIDGTIRIWSADGTALATLRGHTNEVIQVRFSPDNTWIASASLDGTAAIWKVASGERLHVLTGHAYKLRTIEWYADGRRVVTGSMDKTAKVWDAESGALLGTVTGTDKLAFAQVSPTGDRIITGGADHVAQLWDANTFQPIAKLADHRGVVWRAAFSPDGRRVVTGSDDHVARVWDSATGSLLATYTDHTRKISHVAVSPDGELVATSSEDGTARIWRANSTETVATLAHEAPVWYVAFSPDGTRVVTASSDGTAALWRVADGTRLWTFVGHTDRVSCSVFSPDGTRLATASDDRTARIWDARRTVVRASFSGQRGVLWDARFSPNGDRVATAADDRTVWIRDATGRALATWDDERITERVDVYRFARWGPGGDWFVTLHDGAVDRRDARTAKLIRSYPTKAARFAMPSHDGRRLAIADANATRIVDVDTGETIATLEGHTAPITTVDWSPDDRQLLTAGEDNTARLWEVASARQIAVIEHGAWLVGGWFSPIGDRFMTAAADRTVTVWSAATRAAIAHFDDEAGGVEDAAWSPDGELIVTGSADATVRVWAATTGRLLSIVGRHRDEVVAVSFHPDGRQVLSSSVDGTAQIWTLTDTDVDLAKLVARARCRVPYYIERGLLTKRSSPCLQE